MQYVGIAADEERRLARLKPGQVSLLDRYHITGRRAMEMCRDAGLVSPIYLQNHRGGCFFCPNMRADELIVMKALHPQLYQELKRLSEVPDTCTGGYKWGKTFAQIEKEIRNRSAQLAIPFDI